MRGLGQDNAPMETSSWGGGARRTVPTTEVKRVSKGHVNLLLASSLSGEEGERVLM